MSSFVPESLLEHLRSLRHDIHRHPELGFHEVRTRETVERELASCTDAVFTRMATTGLVVDIKGTNDQLAQSRPARCVALRADLDALDMTEENEHLPYRSQAYEARSTRMPRCSLAHSLAHAANPRPTCAAMTATLSCLSVLQRCCIRYGLPATSRRHE